MLRLASVHLIPIVMQAGEVLTQLLSAPIEAGALCEKLCAVYATPAPKRDDAVRQVFTDDVDEGACLASSSSHLTFFLCSIHRRVRLGRPSLVRAARHADVTLRGARGRVVGAGGVGGLARAGLPLLCTRLRRHSHPPLAGSRAEHLFIVRLLALILLLLFLFLFLFLFPPFRVAHAKLRQLARRRVPFTGRFW